MIIALDRAMIVIPCLNEETHLPVLLAWLAREAAGGLIVVADGGSRDRSRAIVEEMAIHHPEIRLLDNPRRLQSAALNLAAATFGGGREWLIRIDAHCRYPDGYIAGLLAAAERQGVSSVVVPMVTEGHACFQRAVAAAQNSLLGTGGSPHRHVTVGQFVDHGHHALFQLASYLAAGGYDEGFSHNEDAELDQRLVRQGARIWLEPSQAITYYPRGAPGPLLRQYYHYGRGRARTLARHRPPIKLRQMLPLAVAPALLLAALGIATGLAWPPALLLVLPALSWTLACLTGGVALAARGRSTCLLFSGVAAMLMHAGWSTGFWGVLLGGPALGPEPTPLG